MLPMFMQKPFDVQYFQHLKRLFGTALIGYWPLDEAAGASTVTDYSGQANDGTPSNVTFGQAGIGDGRTAASFNGTTSYCNIYSAGLNSDFNTAAGTMALWVKVSGAGVWTDNITRRIFRILTDGNNAAQLFKTDTNVLRFNYDAGGVGELVDYTHTGLNWFHIALTWDVSGGGEMKAYFNGAQTGSTQTGLGTWVGALTNTTCCIGSGNITPTECWSGNLAHAVLLNQVATAQEVGELAR